MVQSKITSGFLIPKPPNQTADEPSVQQRSQKEIEAEIEAVAEVVNHCCAGGGGEFFSADEKGVTVHHNLEVYTNDDDDDMAALETSSLLDTTITIDVGSVVAPEIRPGQGAQVTAKEVIPFVLLKFNPDTDKHWTVPELKIFHDLLNRVEGEIMVNNLECGDAYKWANQWGRVGLLGLSPKNIDHINEYRTVVESQLLGQTRFTIFPKDGLERKGTVSVLLREHFRSFKVEWLPMAIMKRNKKLKGGLRLTHTKMYADTDVSRAGACKKGWRLALLQGCHKFMKSLEQFDQEHRFPVGSSHVIIRGGANRPKGSGPGQSRQDRGRAPTMTGRGKDDRAKSREQQQSRGRGEKNQSGNYDRSYPPGGLVAMGSGRGTGSVPNTGPSSKGRGNVR